MQSLTGQLAFITGGGSGIGRALALALADHGADVCVADLRLQAAEHVAAEVGERGARALAVECDVSDRASVREAAAQVVEHFGQVDLLFANAGVTSFKEVADLTDDDWDWVYGVDVFGVTNCLQAFLPGMIARGSGHVVTTASLAGLIPIWQPRHAPYSSAKALVIALTVNMRPELAAHGIGTTVVCPGGVRTQILQTSSVRPSRFGQGAAPAPIDPPAQPTKSAAHPGVREPHEVADMVIDAIKQDHLFVLTDSTLRPVYAQYSDQVHAAFDRLETFDAAEVTS